MATYACSDLHGMMPLYKQIKNFLSPDDKVYYLGDAGDRGPNSWELIKTIYNDNQFIYIKGNHEDMLMKSMIDYIKYDGLCDKNYYHLCSNGGEITFYDWTADGASAEWINKIRELPVCQTYTNVNDVVVYLTHAGFTPVYDKEDKIVIPDEEDLIWNRYHFTDPWPVDTENVTIVHGHTPTPYLADHLRKSEEIEIGHAFWYANRHKVDIDVGAVFTGRACLLDLDSFDEHVFEIPGFVFI